MKERSIPDRIGEPRPPGANNHKERRYHNSCARHREGGVVAAQSGRLFRGGGGELSKRAVGQRRWLTHERREVSL